MLASEMESKTQTYPNIGLEEIEDVSAAFKYEISDKMMNNLWVYDFNIHEESQTNQISSFPDQESSEFTVSDPGLSSRFLIDIHQNIENDDPNSMKILCSSATTDDMKTIKTINQKRIKGPRSKRCRRTVFDFPYAFTPTPSMDLYGSIDNQGSAMNEFDKPTFKIQKGVNLAHNLDNDDQNSESIGVNSVGRWLEDVGFGRYAGVFERHEVDEEALPLLTIDDLKEMGVLAVGTRRKLYAAIRRLRDG